MTVAIRVSIVRWMDDEPQPGIVECRLTDRHGRDWTFIEKCGVASSTTLHSGSTYRPVHSAITLTIARKGQDAPIELTIVRAPVGAAKGASSDLQVAVRGGKLQVEASGALPVLDFGKGTPMTVVPLSSREFLVDGGDHTRLAFLEDGDGKATGLVLNPGPWEITGQRIN